MASRERATQARHVMLLSNDAPVLNRCAKEEAHLKHRLAQSTAACVLMTQRNHAAAAREERSRELRLQAQFAALLSGKRGVVVPSSSTVDLTDAAERDSGSAAATDRFKSHSTAATGAAVVSSPGLKSSSAVAASGSATPAASLLCALGFPDTYEASGFKSMIHWASVAYDETFLTAYGPRQIREVAQAQAIARAGGSSEAREAQPHRLMTAVACYLLNQVLCADAAVSELWQEKLRQPIFDAIFSSQPIATGQEPGRAQRGGDVGDAAVADAIVHRMIGPPSPLSCAATHSSVATSFPPRTNTYTTRDDFASLRLWTEEVTVENREKVSLCHRIRSLQYAMARRQMAVHLFQGRAHHAELQVVFTVWCTHTKQRRANRTAIELYVVNRHHRYVTETIFLRWRRFTLRAKVEALQRRVLKIAADRECAAREHAAALQELQDQLATVRRQHVQKTFERDTLHAQVLDSHALEVDALQLMLQMERVQAAQSSKWATRWERVAKTFRPAKPCPAVPRSMWMIARALLCSEEALAVMILNRSGAEQALLQIPYSVILQTRERLEQLLLMWVNAIMEVSPQASTWVTVEAFMYGHRSHLRGVLLSQKKSSRKVVAPRTGVTTGAAAAGKDGSTCEFSIYTLICLVRELRRCYIKAGLMESAEGWGTSGGSTVADCYQELTHLLAAQTCGGLYPPLLVHCSSSPLWFTPEGVFGEPASRLAGSKRQQRQQHTAFIWVLASLLVGHIQVMWMSPLGDREAQLGRSSKEGMETLRCKYEADMMKLAQVSFVLQHRAPPAGLGAAPRGTSVVAPNTLLPKKRAVASLVASFPAVAAAAARPEKDATVATEMTLEEMLRERCEVTRGSGCSNSCISVSGKDLLAIAEDSLSDIEAFLGMVPAQVQSLKLRAGANGNEDDYEVDEDVWVNGLLQQLFEVEGAESQLRRNMRLQSSEVIEDDATDGRARSATTMPASAFGDDEESGGGWKGDDAATGEENARSTYRNLSKSTVTLTREQLQLLRSLPGRSYGFDTLRPIAIGPAQGASVAGEDLTDSSSTARYTSVAHLYSFLLNTLDDTVARQQWCGLARIVTSLAVRFHVLDDSEDAARQAAALAAVKDEYEELKSSRVVRESPERRTESPPSSTSRLPPVSVGCSPGVPEAGKARTGAAGAASPARGGRVAARLVPATLLQQPQPPSFPSTANVVPRRPPGAHSAPSVNIALNTGATPSQRAAEAGVSVVWTPPVRDLRGATATPAQALTATVSSIMLSEELHSRGAYQPNSTQDSLNGSSPVGSSAQGAPSSSPSHCAVSRIGAEAPVLMVPPPSAEVPTPVIPTAAPLPAQEDGRGVRDYVTESPECIAGITSSGGSAFCPPMAGNAGTTAGTAYEARMHAPVEVLARERGAGLAPPPIPMPASSLSNARDTTPGTSSSLRPDNSCSTAIGSYSIPRQNATLQTPLPPTLRARAPPLLSAPTHVLGHPPDPITVQSESSNSLSPLVIRHDPSQQLGSQRRRQYCFRMGP
nr:unnamed protein product [Leishmania braziliensis]